MNYLLNRVVADVYGGGGYSNGLYSQGTTQSTTGTGTGSNGSGSSGGSLVNTGSAAVLITVIAVIILIGAFLVSIYGKRSKK